MKLTQFRSFLVSVCAAVALPPVTVTQAQTNPPATVQPAALTADEDRQKMMDQLGITALRPGVKWRREGARSRELRRVAGESVSEPS